MTTLSVRARWLFRAVLTSSVVGAAGGVLSFLGGDEPAEAVLAGGAASGGAMAPSVAILAFVLPPGRAGAAQPPDTPEPKG